MSGPRLVFRLRCCGSELATIEQRGGEAGGESAMTVALSPLCVDLECHLRGVEDVASGWASAAARSTACKESDCCCPVRAWVCSVVYVE